MQYLHDRIISKSDAMMKRCRKSEASFSRVGQKTTMHCRDGTVWTHFSFNLSTLKINDNDDNCDTKIAAECEEGTTQDPSIAHLASSRHCYMSDTLRTVQT